MISTLANAMSKDQLLDSPASVLDAFPNAIDLLAGEHFIIRTGNRIAFFHESFFDYAFSRSFVAEGRRILDFLQTDEQFLFRRTQVRQILTAYRQSGNTVRYLAELQEVITSSEVRYHLKDGVVRWLAILDDPYEGELDVVLALDKCDERMPPLVSMALYPQLGWFPWLKRRELFNAWLQSPNEDRRRDALNILRNAGHKFPTDVANILRSWWSNDAERAKELLQWFSWLGEQRPDPQLLALNLELIRSKPPGLFDERGSFDRHSLASWIKNDPAAAGEILKAWFETWFEIYPDNHPFERNQGSGNDDYWLAELRKKSPEAFLDAAVPAFVRTINRINRTYHGEQWDDSTWLVRREKDHYGSDFFLALIRTALTDVAKIYPQKAKDYLDRIDPASHPAVLFLYLEMIASNGEELGKILPSLLACGNILEVGYSGAEWLSFALATKSTLPYLNAVERKAIEDRILNYWEELKHAKEIAIALSTGQPQNELWNRKAVTYYLNNNGFKQWCILKTISPEHLSEAARARLSQMDRKFRGERVAEPNNISGGLVPPPIKKERAKFMTDAQWLKAFAKYSENRDGFRKAGRWIFHSGSRGLAQVLQEQTKEDPDRFARLLFRLPEHTAQDYLEGIFFGLAESQASQKTLLSAIQYAHFQTDRSFGAGICRIFQQHPYLGQDERAFEVLLWYVENGQAVTEGESDEKRAEQEIVNVENLLQRGSALMIRGAYGDRGAAAEALGSVIWECPSRLEKGVKVLNRRAATESLRSIRCCLTQPIYSVLRYDNRRAATLLRLLVIRNEGLDLTPLTTHYGLHSLFYILHGSPEIGRELLNYLLESNDEGQQLIGAFHLFREAFYDSDFAPRANTLISKGDVYRKLAADAAANHLSHADYRSRAENQLLRFFDDPLKEVRAEAANCFRHLETERFDSYRTLLRSFIRSKAFEAENFGFFFLLKEARDQTSEEVVMASERLLELVVGDVKKGGFPEMHYLDELILREYTAVADRPALRKRLLDIIDRMLILGIHGTDQIVKEHERG